MRNKENGKRTQKKTRRQRSRLSANVTREVTENACHLIQVISVKKLAKIHNLIARSKEKHINQILITE